jgi:ATP-dependent helicase/nuclease subunit B
VEALRAGRYQIMGMEVPVEGTMEGRRLEGSIDCLIRRADGAEGILDFKYRDSRDGKYRRLLREGRSVQLATYARARRQTSGGAMPAVGYLILADGLLYTPEGSALAGGAGTMIAEGPAIAAVWDRFTGALGRAEGWRTGDAPVPARPLEDPEDWPEGATIVLDAPDAKGKPAESQPICTYCDYQALCGVMELT